MTERPQLDLSDYLPYLINRVGAAFVNSYEKELARHDLSIAMWRVIAALSHGGRQRQIDISDLTSIEVSTTSRLITRLAKSGLVSRARSDSSHREVTVQLTPKGRALANKLIPLARKLERDAVAGLSHADVAITRNALRRMYDNMTGLAERTEIPKVRKSA